MEALYQPWKPGGFHRDHTALLCIDLQYHDAAPGYGFFKDVRADDPRYGNYFERLNTTVFPAVKALQDLFRQEGAPVIHVRIQSLTKDGRDRSLEHKRMGCHVAPGSQAARFIAQVAPVEDEIVLSKTASGVFNATNIDYILKNLGVEQLVVVGVLTNECVETAVRDAADRSYEVVVVEEGTAALHPQAHRASLQTLNGVYCDVCTLKEALVFFESNDRYEPLGRSSNPAVSKSHIGV